MGTPEASIHLNSVGYVTDQKKTATLVGMAGEGVSFTVSDSSGNRVFQGVFGPPVSHPDMEAPVRRGDFSPLTGPGTYRIQADGLDIQSPWFTVGDGVYNDSLRLCMLGFYGQRCGVPVRLEHRGKVFEKKACHTEDGYLDYYDPNRKGERKDASGGWHDAGDYGKYIVNAGFAMGMMFSAWEHFGGSIASLQLPIPETGGTLPDYLAECKFNLDWMLKMQFDDGRVSHKLTRTTFAPMVMPHEDTEKRYFVPWGTDATACFAAVTAQASRVFRDYDPGYADVCRSASGKAMHALKEVQGSVNADQSAFRTGRYARIRHTDMEWALCEYWETTGDEEVYRLLGFTLHNENFHVDVDWDWGLSRNLGLYTLLRSKRELPPGLKEELEQDLIAAADRLVANSRQHPFGRGLKRNYWGCNGSIARTTMNLMEAFRISGDEIYRLTALDQLSYIYGNNPFGRSFVTGDGHNPPMNPHHRPSAADGIRDPWPGHLVGGPHPTELDWYDVTEDPRTNETAINWDAALVYALAAFYDPVAEQK
ncbi:MAG: glycoside hydrolase family 9 protein [Spirochaetales bacterium]|nr:glycoside hydrolase family 9 protein [Spirochaetales bacterium]